MQKFIYVSLLLFVVSLSNLGLAQQACDQASNCRGRMTFSTGKKIPYYRTFSLSQNSSIRQAVIVVHGNSRNPDSYFDRTVEAARMSGRLNSSAIVAPFFQTENNNPASNEHYWSSAGWKIGNKSQDASRVSSFKIMDEIIAKFCTSGDFSNLTKLTVIGHSAGGQFVNRYIGGGRGCQSSSIRMRYVVMNPSSYLYIDGSRPVSDSDGFGIPMGAGCPDYNEYKYGFDDMNTYMRNVGASEITRRMFRRRAVYLGGTEDDFDDGGMDISCEANYQGSQRFARFRNYQRYTDRFPAWDNAATFKSVHGVGHSSRRMLQSQEAREVMF